MAEVYALFSVYLSAGTVKAGAMSNNSFRFLDHFLHIFLKLDNRIVQPWERYALYKVTVYLYFPKEGNPLAFSVQRWLVAPFPLCTYITQ